MKSKRRWDIFSFPLEADNLGKLNVRKCSNGPIGRLHLNNQIGNRDDFLLIPFISVFLPNEKLAITYAATQS